MKPRNPSLILLIPNSHWRIPRLNWFRQSEKRSANRLEEIAADGDPLEKLAATVGFEI